jgi:hypothetical protein
MNTKPTKLDNIDPYKLHIINTLMEMYGLIWMNPVYTHEQFKSHNIKVLHKKIRDLLAVHPSLLKNYRWMLPLIPE